MRRCTCRLAETGNRSAVVPLPCAAVVDSARLPPHFPPPKQPPPVPTPTSGTAVPFSLSQSPRSMGFSSGDETIKSHRGDLWTSKSPRGDLFYFYSKRSELLKKHKSHRGDLEVHKSPRWDLGRSELKFDDDAGQLNLLFCLFFFAGGGGDAW